jgi:hypothetical protein
MKTRVAWIVVALFAAILILVGTQPPTTTAGTPGGPLDLADAVISSRPINIATTADSLVLAAGSNRIALSPRGIGLVTQHQIIDMNTEHDWIYISDGVNREDYKGNSIILDYQNSRMVFASHNGHSLEFIDTPGAESIALADANGENAIVIDITNNKLVLRTTNGSIDVHAPNGTTDLKATTLKVETIGDMTYKSANTKIEAKQDYSLKATNVKAEATMDYKEKGMNVKSEASMEHKSKGMNVTSEAGVNMQVKGTMVTVQSSGPNTIKGMPVLIN